jgi:tRNA threonylcarbamoyladenosine biosynthesis protein TsaB
MSVILLIDTALDTASVGTARAGELLAFRENARQNDHAAWLHPSIEELFAKTGITAKQLDAVGVTAGPGSYTGLRVGMAAAKGICYAMNIPLLSVSTLQLLAASVRENAPGLIVSLIDARRDEVYAGVFDQALNPVEPERPMIIGADSFQDLRGDQPITLTGNGAQKMMNITSANDFCLIESKGGIRSFALLAYKKWLIRDFVDMAYHEPVYLKEFYTKAKEN